MAAGQSDCKTPSGGRTLLVFDIDGTLCDSTACHERAFSRALSAGGLRVDAIDPAGLLHYTDSWLFAELFQRRFSRPPESSEVVLFEKLFTDEFRHELEQNPFTTIPGARETLQRCAADRAVEICFVTGSFAGAALLKLEVLGIAPEDFVVVTASDFQVREDAVRCAIEKKLGRHPDGFTRVVSIGDGWWDFTAAQNLGLDFIAVNMAAASREKLPAGVSCLEDFSEADELLRLIRAR